MLGDLVEGRREACLTSTRSVADRYLLRPPQGQTALLGSQGGFKRDEYRNDQESGQYTRPVLERPHFARLFQWAHASYEVARLTETRHRKPRMLFVR